MTAPRKYQHDLSPAAWAVVIRLPRFGYGEIETALSISRDRSKFIVRSWEADGAIVPVIEPGLRRKMWIAKRDFVWPTGRDRGPDDLMWMVIRKLKRFQPVDLQAHIAPELAEITLPQASAYCQLLLAAGYLRVIRRAAPAMKRQAIYQLVVDHGAAAPVRRMVPAIFDPNTGETRLIEGARA